MTEEYTIGLPEAYWHAQHARPTTIGFTYGPITFDFPGGFFPIKWTFYLANDSSQTTLVRISGGELRSDGAQMRLLKKVQQHALQTYHRAAVAARMQVREDNRRKYEIAQEQIRRRKAEEEANSRREMEESKQRAAEKKRLEAQLLEAERNRVWPSSSIIIGIDIKTGKDVRIDTGSFQHTLVGGMTGAGKTIWLHGILGQLFRADTVERMVLIDLKRVEFKLRYAREAKAEIYTELGELPAVFEGLVELMAERETIMLANGWRNWKGSRVFVVADEYSEIHDFIEETRREPSQKATALRMANNLKRVVQRARSSGIVLICALQKSTADGISSAIRANMGMRACFRVKTRQSVEAVLDTMIDDLPLDPRDLVTGQFVMDNGQGGYLHLKTWVPPEFDFGD